MKALHHGWRAAVVAVAAGSAASLNASADAPPPSASSAPSQFEVDAYASTSPISSRLAEGRLLAQARIPALVSAARAALGASFGGVWVDNDADDQIILGVVSSGDSSGIAPRVATLAHDAIAEAGLDGVVDVSPVPRSEADVVALQAKLDEELVSVNAGASVTIDAEPDVKTARVRLSVPSAATVAQQELLRGAKDRFGDAVILGPESTPLIRSACSGGAPPTAPKSASTVIATTCTTARRTSRNALNVLPLTR